MATNPKMHHPQPLPVGLEKNGLAIWHLLSDKQKQKASEFCMCDEAYHTRFCSLLNDEETDPSIVLKGGVLSGLSYEGKKVWDMLEPDVQLEVFLTSANDHVSAIQKFINAVKIGQLTLAQIERGIETLANEKKKTNSSNHHRKR